MLDKIKSLYTSWKINKEKAELEYQETLLKEAEEFKVREQARKFKEDCEERRAHRRRDDNYPSETDGYCGMLCI